MHRHADTFLSLDELGSCIPPYRPTFDFAGPYIDSAHQGLATCPVKDGFLIQIKNSRWFGQVIPGWLRREDALKLYEIAYFVAADILELGSFHGLSTSILSRANHNAPVRKSIYSVDLDPVAVQAARIHLRRQRLDRNVRVEREDALSAVRRMAASGKLAAMVFVDHSHEYDPVYDVCRAMATVLQPGGFCLFHDFNDIRNRDAGNQDYGVYQAVVAGLDPAEFDFYGLYGVTAVYRRHAA
jgi:SAM-dependent methyltransferase